MSGGEALFWLALTGCPRFGAKQYRKLAGLLEDLSWVFSLPDTELAHFGFSQKQIEYISSVNWSELERELEWCESNEVHLLSISCSHYPQQLAEISNPPLLLYVKGELACLNEPQFAFIGSRNPSPYGQSVASKLAGEMATTNALVTSGMAIGIDGIAHNACLNAGGKTIAVLGSGLNHIYPKRHIELAQRICQHGALISEFHPNTAPIQYNFPRRNRIISGLSNATIVIEAAEKSGSLVTAKYALEQGRDVFAVPGNINNPLAKGPHTLLKQGAKLVETLDDIIEEFVLVRTSAKVDQKKNLAESKLLASVDHDTTPVDVIVRRSNLPVEQVLTELLNLEVQGLVAAVPGGYIRQA